MKNKILIFLILALSLSSQAMNYSIVSVEPNILVPGANTFIIKLDQNKALNDSCNASIFVYKNGDMIKGYEATSVTWVDSSLTAMFDIPQEIIDSKGILSLNIMNTNDWSFQFLKFSDSIQIGGGIYSVTPDICIVTVDTSDHNVIVWDAFQQDFLDSVLIYKETEVLNEFKKIGSVPIEATSVFVDEESLNAQNSNRYKIALIDTSGNISLRSDPHKTLHLTINEGLNGTVNLIWEKYEGFNYTTYEIYRGSSKQDMMKIAEVASNLFSFSDLNPPLGNQYYQVAIENPTPCNITNNKSATTNYSLTKSNIVEHFAEVISINENSKDFLNIYPNPVTDHLKINIENLTIGNIDVVIRDVAGQTIKAYSSFLNGSEIDLSDLKSGMYFISVSSNNIKHIQKIIKK